MIKYKAVRYMNMRDLFQFDNPHTAMDDPIIYRVEEYDPIGTKASAITWLHPGQVAREFYMTKGHTHEKPSAENYQFLHGHGLVYMFHDKDRPCILAVTAGDNVVVPAGYAHRVINTGSDDLVFLATYDKDAGHDYSVEFPLHFGGEQT